MKTLTTLAAAIALIAGVSVANAAEPSTSKDTSMGAGTMSQPAEVIGTREYCTKVKTGELLCNYASLSACQNSAEDANCVANPQTGTTGAGDSMK